MSNETKQDVFNEVRYKFRNFKNEHRHGMYASPDSIDHYLSDALKRYDNALPDDLPVIPEAVAYAIEWFQQNDETIGEVWRNLYEDVDDDWHECPQLREAEEWMLDNQDTFTRAWVLGQWEAEK